MSRRHLQIALGLLWLLDGALQLQPFMLGIGFARQVIDPVAAEQPGFVAVPVHWAANLIVAHPIAWDLPFAAVQLLIGLGLLLPRTIKLALAGSILWSLGVWFFGEGLSGLASGHASLLTGAPSAARVQARSAGARDSLVLGGRFRWTGRPLQRPSNMRRMLRLSCSGRSLGRRPSQRLRPLLDPLPAPRVPAPRSDESLGTSSSAASLQSS